MNKEYKEHIKEIYLEFIYCLYKGLLPNSRFLFISNEINKSFLEEAYHSFYNDPVFYNIYMMNLKLSREVIDNNKIKDN